LSSRPGGRIPYIGVTYSELRDMEYGALEGRISANLVPYFDGIDFMGRAELESLRESVKGVRRQSFRFADTDDIGKARIQLALSKLARLFRLADDKIRESKD